MVDPDETVTMIDEVTEEITSKRKEKVAVKCPCEKEECGTLIGVRKYSHLGSGRHNCPHCGFIPKNKWNGVAEFKGHFDTHHCRAKRGLSPAVSAKTALGAALCHGIDDPDYKSVAADGKEFYKSFACATKVSYRMRFEHSRNCFPNISILLPKP